MAATNPASPADKRRGSPKSAIERESRRRRRENYHHAVEAICLKANVEWTKKAKAFKEKQEEEARQSGEKKKRMRSPKFSPGLLDLATEVSNIRRFNIEMKRTARRVVNAFDNGVHGDLIKKLEAIGFPDMAKEAQTMRKFYLSVDWRVRVLKGTLEEMSEDFGDAIVALKALEKLVQCAA
ncbi:uncharacterized protein BKA78DRAFT_97105 [Phyllosticta capitalensis]|uniref:uncharacterized protein n=1 Tax=Phyllosticta capitalensis TaxID=121624 RepID=UPI00312D9A59